MPAKGSAIPLADRFWPKVDKSGECWLWTAALDAGGYGHIQVAGKAAFAHRVSWEMANGPIPNGLKVLHNCPGGDNRACVNPAHLWLGTNADNSRDMSEKGRSARGSRNGMHTHPERRPHNTGPRPTMRGSKNPQAKLTFEIAERIRERHHSGVNQRALAIEFGYSRWTIHCVISGKRWIHP